MILADESPQFEIEPLRSAPVKPPDRDGIDPQVAANLAKLRYWIRFPGPDASLSPQFGIPGFQENLRTFSGRISLLKNGAEMKVLAAFGAGRTLPGVLTCKLSQQDYAALKDDGARFTLGIFDARGKLVQEVARQ